MGQSDLWLPGGSQQVLWCTMFWILEMSQKWLSCRPLPVIYLIMIFLMYFLHYCSCNCTMILYFYNIIFLRLGMQNKVWYYEGSLGDAQQLYHPKTGQNSLKMLAEFPIAIHISIKPCLALTHIKHYLDLDWPRKHWDPCQLEPKLPKKK